MEDNNWNRVPIYASFGELGTLVDEWNDSQARNATMKVVADVVSVLSLSTVSISIGVGIFQVY